MSLAIDESDPCAAAAALRAVYYDLVAGQAALQVTFKAGSSGVERAVTFHRAEVGRLKGLIASFESQCAKLNGTRLRRYALSAGGQR